jgi:hypothetical protein
VSSTSSLRTIVDKKQEKFHGKKKNTDHTVVPFPLLHISYVFLQSPIIPAMLAVTTLADYKRSGLIDLGHRLKE